jgi:hypothetical protein
MIKGKTVYDSAELHAALEDITKGLRDLLVAWLWNLHSDRRNIERS